MDLVGWLFAGMIVVILLCMSVYVLAGIFLQALVMVVLLIQGIRATYQNFRDRG